MTDIYGSLLFPKPPEGRPYVFIDMVATIDGKILSGSRNESVADLGSKLDHFLLRRLEGMADAILVGAGTLRTIPQTWRPQAKKRFVVSGTGDVPFDAPFFEEQAFLATTTQCQVQPPAGIGVVKCGDSSVDLGCLLSEMSRLGVTKLLVLGGSELNAHLLREDLVDELFLTIAPKIKLGRDVPTYAGGEPLQRDELKSFELLESHAVHDEVFLRYRRRSEA